MAERPQGYCLRRRPLQHPAEPETWDLGTLTTAYQTRSCWLLPTLLTCSLRVQSLRLLLLPFPRLQSQPALLAPRPTPRCCSCAPRCGSKCCPPLAMFVVCSSAPAHAIPCCRTCFVFHAARVYRPPFARCLLARPTRRRPGWGLHSGGGA